MNGDRIKRLKVGQRHLLPRSSRAGVDNAGCWGRRQGRAFLFYCGTAVGTCLPGAGVEEGAGVEKEYELSTLALVYCGTGVPTEAAAVRRCSCQSS